jgi:hypothetical protein
MALSGSTMMSPAALRGTPAIVDAQIAALRPAQLAKPLLPGLPNRSWRKSIDWALRSAPEWIPSSFILAAVAGPIPGNLATGWQIRPHHHARRAPSRNSTYSVLRSWVSSAQ